MGDVRTIEGWLLGDLFYTRGSVKMDFNLIIVVRRAHILWLQTHDHSVMYQQFLKALYQQFLKRFSSFSFEHVLMGSCFCHADRRLNKLIKKSSTDMLCESNLKLFHKWWLCSLLRFSCCATKKSIKFKKLWYKITFVALRRRHSLFDWMHREIAGVFGILPNTCMLSTRKFLFIYSILHNYSLIVPD